MDRFGVELAAFRGMRIALGLAANNLLSLQARGIPASFLCRQLRFDSGFRR